MKTLLDYQNEKPRSPRKSLLSWLAVILALLFLYLALYKLDWPAFISILRNANYRLVPLILLWSSASNWVRALRWRILLTADKDIPARNVFWANMAGYLGNNILPARAGEWIRAVYVSQENNLSLAYSLATGLVERFIDLVALVVLGSIAIVSVGILSQQLQDALRVMTVIAIIGTVTLLVLPYFGEKLHLVLEKFPLLNPPAKQKLGGVLEQFLRGFRALHHPTRLLTFILFTCLIWLMDGVGVIILARSLHIQLSIMDAFLLLAGLGLSSAIPSTPGYIGIYQLVAVLVLQPLGISNASAIALIIFIQIAGILIVAFWGGLSLWRAAYLFKPKE